MTTEMSDSHTKEVPLTRNGLFLFFLSSYGLNLKLSHEKRTHNDCSLGSVLRYSNLKLKAELPVTTQTSGSCLAEKNPFLLGQSSNAYMFKKLFTYFTSDPCLTMKSYPKMTLPVLIIMNQTKFKT